MEPYTLPRTGIAPLKFTGEVIAKGSSAEDKSVRWHELTIYRTKGGNWVAHVCYKTEWKGEIGHDMVYSGTVEDVVQAIEQHDPKPYVQGFPDHSQFRDRQAALLDFIQTRWDALITRVLGELPEAAEEIE